MRNLSWVIGLAAVAGLAACGGTEEDGAGRLDVALAAQSASGALYRLRDATLAIDGSAAQLIFHTEDDPARSVVSAHVPAGHYALTLRDGWRLERVAADGTAVNVNAMLTSANPRTFEVASGEATQVRLRFSVDGRPVQTGDGEVDVGIDVDETPDGGPIDAPPIDAPPIDAPPVDAPPIDAPPVDAPPIDAPPADSCASEAACPPPGPGRTTLCGRVYDVEDTASFTLAAGDAVQVAAYDALAYVNDITTPPLAGIAPDACGRFVVPDVPVPSTGYISLAVVGATASEPLVPTAIAVGASPGTMMGGLHLFATRSSTEAAWSGAAHTSVAARGAYLAIYLDGNVDGIGPFFGAPRAGFTVLVDGSTRPADDYYFSDFSPLSRRSVFNILTSTGADGSALLVGGPLVSYSGVASGCDVPSFLGATVPGLIVVQEYYASCQ